MALEMGAAPRRVRLAGLPRTAARGRVSDAVQKCLRRDGVNLRAVNSRRPSPHFVLRIGLVAPIESHSESHAQGGWYRIPDSR
jgi:hypothetical protein